MANSERGAREIVASLVDRLTDDAPEAQHEPVVNRLQSVNAFRAAVAKDLENLLNTRREALEDLDPHFEQLNRSLLVYGLPDFTAFNLLDVGDLARLRRAIESAIANFESRLQLVRVTM